MYRSNSCQEYEGVVVKQGRHWIGMLTHEMGAYTSYRFLSAKNAMNWVDEHASRELSGNYVVVPTSSPRETDVAIRIARAQRYRS